MSSVQQYNRVHPYHWVSATTVPTQPSIADNSFITSTVGDGGESLESPAALSY